MTTTVSMLCCLQTLRCRHPGAGPKPFLTVGDVIDHLGGGESLQVAFMLPKKLI